MSKFFNRPLTPHLTIYTPQILSLFSIWHRITSVYIIIYVLFYIILYKFFLILNNQVFSYLFLITYVLNYIFFLCLYYHFLNGLRHMFWDLGLFLTKKYLIKLNLLLFSLILISQVFFFKNYLIYNVS